MRSCASIVRKDMRFQVPPKAFRLEGRTTQRIRQWVPNGQTGDWERAKCCDETAECSVCDGWPNADVGGRKLRRLARSSRRGTKLELATEDTDEQSRQACTVPAME